MATVLVAGCGYVGTALGRRLAAAGHVVHGLRRDPSGLPPQVRPIAADLGDPASLDRALPDAVELVAYTAAATGSSAAQYVDAYVRGTRNLLEALARRRAPVRRVVFTSSTGVYAQDAGEWVDESSDAAPAEATGRALLEGERIVLSGPFPGAVLRLAGIYGPGRTRLLDDVAAGRARRPPAPRWTNRIHRDDCAGAIAHLLAAAASPAVTLGVDHEPADLADVQAWLAERLGVPAPPLADDDDASRRARPGGKRCSNAALLASGYRFEFPTFREGYSAMAGWRIVTPSC